jgi:hydrogenase maturation protease
VTAGRVLVAGFGNLLLGDDGFGVAVVRKLSGEPVPAGVETLEVGTGGMELVFGLMGGFERLIIVDAVRRGHAPGTLYVFRPSEADLAFAPDQFIDPHFAEPTRALKLAKTLGYLPPDVTVVGCEPGPCDLDMALSPPVRAAVDQALGKVRESLGASHAV